MRPTESVLSPGNQQGLDIRSTPRQEMGLYPLDTFFYEFPGREIKINFEITEFTAICPFSDFPDFATIRIRPIKVLSTTISICCVWDRELSAKHWPRS